MISIQSKLHITYQKTKQMSNLFADITYWFPAYIPQAEAWGPGGKSDKLFSLSELSLRCRTERRAIFMKPYIINVTRKESAKRFVSVAIFTDRRVESGTHRFA